MDEGISGTELSSEVDCVISSVADAGPKRGGNPATMRRFVITPYVIDHHQAATILDLYLLHAHSRAHTGLLGLVSEQRQGMELVWNWISW